MTTEIRISQTGPFISSMMVTITSETTKAYQLDGKMWFPKSAFTERKYLTSNDTYLELKDWFRRKMNDTQWRWIESKRDTITV